MQIQIIPCCFTTVTGVSKQSAENLLFLLPNMLTQSHHFFRFVFAFCNCFCHHRARNSSNMWCYTSPDEGTQLPDGNVQFLPICVPVPIVHRNLVGRVNAFTEMSLSMLVPSLSLRIASGVYGGTTIFNTA